MKNGITFVRYISRFLVFAFLSVIISCAPTLEKFRTPYLQGEFDRAEKIGKKVKGAEDRSFAIDMIEKTYLLLKEAEDGRLNHENGNYDVAITHFANAIEIGDGIDAEWTPDTLKFVISECRGGYAEILYGQLTELMAKKLYGVVDDTRSDFDHYVTPNEIRYNELESLYEEAEKNTQEIESMIQEGDSQFDLGKYESAIATYKGALEKGPEYADTIHPKISDCESKLQQIVDDQMRIGGVEIEKNNPDAAMEHFDKAKEIAAKNPQLTLDTVKLDRYLANAAAMKEEIERKKAHEEAVQADKRENGEWMGPFVIDKSRRGQEISAKGHGELDPAATAKWQGKNLIPDNDIVFFEIEAIEGIKVNMFNRPGVTDPALDLIEINFYHKGSMLWRTGDDYGKAWKYDQEKGRYIIQVANSGPNAVPYTVECVIYDSIDR